MSFEKHSFDLKALFDKIDEFYNRFTTFERCSDMIKYVVFIGDKDENIIKKNLDIC